MTENNNSQLKKRSEIPTEHCWDLSKLFKSPEDWEKSLKTFEDMIDKVKTFKGTLSESPEKCLACLEFDKDADMLAERLGYYAHLRIAEDGGNSESRGRMARYMNIAAKYNAGKSYQIPEIQAIPEDVMKSFLATNCLSKFVISLNKILRYKPHILSEPEERLLAMQAECSQTADSSFSALVDVDMVFGEIDTPEGKKPLTQSSYGSLILNPDREIRKSVYTQFLKEFDDHKNTLASLYNGSVQLDVYLAKVRNFESSRHSSLFNDNVPVSVYDNLITSVHNGLPSLHRYYELRKKTLNLDTLHLYDTKVPIISNINVHNTYENAVDTVIKSLAVLGKEYTTTLKEGLIGSWVDRYENQGKQSGAFSAGSYNGNPYILMNYKDDVLNDVFTLAHEAGHSMHSWYSIGNNLFQDYNYTIFVAEVASTFNEQLLSNHLMKEANDKRFKAYLINKQIDDIIGTIYRQTMFAEFEKTTHNMVENNNPLTVDSLRSEYRKLLEKYFGSKVTLEETSCLEGLRIPHFYRAFYVYKYATGLSAAIALSQRVIKGGDIERKQYLKFLKSGGSKYPLEQLNDAGVDMTSPEPVRSALNVFDSLVEQLDRLLRN